MKQNKQVYEAPKVELIEMEAQGVLCGSGGGPETRDMTGTGMHIQDQLGAGDWAFVN